MGGLSDCLKGWLRTILHRSQYSSFQQGILPPIAFLALWTEGAKIGSTKIIVISLDLSKMFNMLSAGVVSKLAVLAGLDEFSASLLSEPIENAHTTWRLPHNSTAPFVSPKRGLPQGLPTSVAGAELMVSLLLRRLEGCCTCEPFSYMDDIHVLAYTVSQMHRVIRIIREFVADLGLEMSSLKTYIWSSSAVLAQQIARNYGFTWMTEFESLGLAWAVGGGRSFPLGSRESKRLAVIRERLARISHLPVPMHVKSYLISASALSLLDFANPPSPSLVIPLRKCVRMALGMATGAPEIVFLGTGKPFLDPYLRHLVSILRIWVFASRMPASEITLDHPKLKSSKGRLGAALRMTKAMGWGLTSRCLTFPGDSDPMDVHVFI